MKPEPTQERLKEALRYEPETGRFIWRVSNNNRIRVGALAGSINGSGYRQIMLDGHLRLAHRLAVIYMTGHSPPAEVDHVNRDRSDNRWSNLRLATKQENQANKGNQRNNTSGHRGVAWSASRNKWRAYGKRCGRTTHLGYFDSLEIAAAAARAWRAANFRAFAG